MIQSEIRRLEAEICYWRGIAEDALAQLKEFKKELNEADEAHFDECTDYQSEIIELRRMLHKKSLN